MASIFRPGATALITGGASGVGFAMATIFRQHGMHLAIIDRSKDNLSAATSALKSQASSATHPGIKTEGYELDVSDLSGWKSIKSQVEATFGTKIDVLMLNAGTSVKPSTTQSYLDVDYFHKTLDTNMYGVVNGLATFLPSVQHAAQSSPASPTAVIITGSKQGITNPPGAANPAYNMSKSALKTLAEHLAHDLRAQDNPSHSPGTSVHLLIPGWTFTGLSGNAGPAPSDETIKNKPAGAWLPSECAEYGAEKIREGKFYIVCPDNDVDEALDQARMVYAMGDVVEGRSALSRWDDRFRDEAAKWIDKEAKRRRG